MRPDRREVIPCGDHEVVAELFSPEPNLGLSPIVLLNGLSDTMESWDPFLKALDRYAGPLARPVVRLDFRGQGATLTRELSSAGGFDAEPSAEEQLSDVLRALEYFGFSGPVQLVGSSYGGGVALSFAARYPERVERALLFVPYVIRLDQANPLARVWTRQMESITQLMGPVFGMLPGAALDLGKREYRKVLDQYMDYRYGRVLKDPIARQAAIRLTFGIMSFDALQILGKIPERVLHLVSVGQDTLVPPSLYDEFWSRLPESSRASWLHIRDGEHLILQQAPDYCALWARKVLDGGPGLSEGRRFDGELGSAGAAV